MHSLFVRVFSMGFYRPVKGKESVEILLITVGVARNSAARSNYVSAERCRADGAASPAEPRPPGNPLARRKFTRQRRPNYPFN